MKKVAIVQSNYIPWKGYFDLIASVDEFILYDDVQFTRRDWRTRNRIKTPNGLKWLTVPVVVKGKYHQTIRETVIDERYWSQKHWGALKANYTRAEHYQEIATVIEPFYRTEYTHISALNRDLIEAICAVLSIRTKISDCTDYNMVDGKSERLANLCRQAGGGVYVSGPAAKTYLDEEIFNRANIDIEWFSYSGYRPYPQLWGDFVHEVSILDLLFNCGYKAPDYMIHTAR